MFKMICNWHRNRLLKKTEINNAIIFSGFHQLGAEEKTVVEEEKPVSEEKPVVRDFVKRIVERIKDGSFNFVKEYVNQFFSCSSYYNIYFNDIKIIKCTNYITIYLLEKKVQLSEYEKNIIIRECEIAICDIIKKEKEKEKIEQEEYISKIEELLK